MKALGEQQISIDCDVIQADGGTRTASITGAWVALHDCLKWMEARSMVGGDVLTDHLAAISCGIYNGTPVLDLDYDEDSEAETDANFVHDRFGRHRGGSGHGGRRAVLARRVFRAHGSRPQGYRRAGRLPEDAVG